MVDLAPISLVWLRLDRDAFRALCIPLGIRLFKQPRGRVAFNSHDASDVQPAS
jgi:hypothetical protein